MLFFNKLLPIFALPLGLVGLLLAVAVWRRRRWPVVAALAVLYVTSTPIVGDAFLGALERRYPVIAPASLDKVDAVVSLGGIFGPPVPAGAGPQPNFGDSVERLEAGIALWQQGKAEWLVFTGGRLPWSNHPEVEGQASRRVAIARGVDASKIVVTDEVGNTADEARVVAKLMRDRGWKKIILITSGWHLPRSARLFRKAGVDFVPFPVDLRTDTNAARTVLDFLPQAEGLTRTETALRELYGIAFYAVTGR